MRPRIPYSSLLACALAAWFGAWSGDAFALACVSQASGNWSAAGTWSGCGGGNPGAGDTVTIQSPHVVTQNISDTVASLTINSGGTLTVGAFSLTVSGATSVSGTLNITSTTGTKTFTGAVTINAGGTWNNSANEAVSFGGNLTNNGTFTSGTGTQTFTAATAQLLGGSAITFSGAVIANNSLTVAKTAGAVTTNGTLTVTGNLTVTSGTLSVANTVAVTGATSVSGTFTNTTVTGTKTFTGGVTINPGGTFSNNTVAELMTIGGNFNNSGTFNSGTGTYTFNSAGQWGGANSISFGGAVTVSAARTVNTPVNVTGALGITGAVTVTNNSTVTAAGAITGSVAGSTWTNAANSTLNVAGALLATGTLNASASGNTVNYNGSGAQTVKLPSGGNSYHLTVSTSGTKTPAAGTHNILGNLTINAGPTFNANTNDPTINVTSNVTVNGTYAASNNAARPLTIGGNLSVSGTYTGNAAPVNLAGDFTRTGAFTSGAGMFTFNGTSAVLQQTLTGATTFTNMTVNNTGLGLNLASNITVTTAAAGTLALTNGTVTTNANFLIVPRACNNAASVTRTNGYVVGNFQKAIPAGASTCVFQIGSSADYTPATLTFTGVGAGGGGLIGRVNTPPADHPNIATSGLDASKSVNRWWALTTTGVTSTPLPAFTNYSATYTFINPGDIDGGANTANFEIERWNGSAWNVTTAGARTATTTQALNVTALGEFAIAEKKPVVPPPGDFNAFETSTTPNPGAITGRIYTKLVGTNFSLDVVAILGGAQHATFTNTVQVDLVTGSTGGLNCPGSPVTIAGTTQNVNLTSGRGTTGAFSVATAYRDVRVRVRFPVASPTVTSCSTDNFSIRPVAFSSVTSPMNNPLDTGAPVAKAGDAFSITAVAGAGYDGTPAVDNTKITPHAGAIQTGSVGGSFGAANPASGVATGASFTYSEVGNFRIEVNGVFDSSFTSVDTPGTDCTNDFSNSLVGGQYGCSFGNGVQTTAIGRFTPDNFDVSLNVPVFTPACTGFTYVGQAFNYSTVPVITVTARNSSGLGNATTKNYRGGGVWRKITNATLTYPGGTDRGYRSLSGTLVTSGLPGTDPVIADGGAGSEGTVTLTFSSGTGLLFQRTAPVAPFDAEFSLAINVIDEDSVAYASNPAKFGNEVAGGGMVFSDLNPATTNDKDVRFGRLRLANANGSQLVPLQVPMETQYWNGSSFITNTADSCTTVTAANVGLGNYTPFLDAGETTPAIAAGPFSAGRKTLTMSAPGAGNNGSVEIVVNLGSTTTIDSCVTWGTTPAPTGANASHLRGQWCGATYTKDPTARASFGQYKGSEEVIFIRENF